MSVEESFDGGSFWQLERLEEDRITNAVTHIADRRAVIDQAKGMLMLLHGIDAEQAFKLLVWQSQENNVKLRDLANQVIKDFQAVTTGDVAATVVYDRRFMSAHTRIVHETGDDDA
jgi:hypothetical protein